MANEKGRFLAAIVHLNGSDRFLLRLSGRNKDLGNDLEIGLAKRGCRSNQADVPLSLYAARRMRAALDRAITQMEKDFKP